MPQLPLAVWLAVVGSVLLLLGCSAATAYAVLRANTRRRVAQWRGRSLVGLVGAAVLPWLIVWRAPIRLTLSIHGLGPLLGWLLLALLAFALLVLLPLATLLCVVVWGMAHSRRGPSVPPAIS